MTTTVTVGIGPVSFADLIAVARHGAAVTISDEALAEIEKSSQRIRDLAN